jgi:glycine oxidase
VVGAGPIGLWCALVLRQAGCAVTLVDAASNGGQRGAGWASGGLLGAVYETVNRPDVPESFTQLAMQSAALWQDAFKTLHLEIVRQSTFIARTPQDASALEATVEHAQTWNHTFEVTSVPAGFVGLSAWSGPEPALDPRLALSALKRACAAAGVQMVSQAVTSATLGVVTLADGQKLQADRIILATGFAGQALSPHITELDALYPVKGQILSVYAPDRPLRQVVRAGRIYLIPRGNQIVIGATSHPHEADLRYLEAPAHEALLQEACGLWPSLASFPIVESWAGVRPATRDGLPLIGPSSQDEALLLATGAYRNGWLLAPAIARAIEAYVLDNAVEDKNLQTFLPARFAK